MTTLIIIGATGELGQKTLDAAICMDGTGWPGKIIATYNNSAPPKFHTRVSWQKLDCADHKSVRELLASQNRLGAVLYCAVPKHGGASGAGGGLVHAGIVEDVANCAEAVVMLDARFVAVSTDLVFDGKIPEGERYEEEAPTCPPNPYGKYKAEMERRLLGLSGKVVVARTSLILSMDGKKFGKGVQFVVDCLEGKHGEIELFTDEWRNMSFSDDLGRAMVELAKEECGHTGLIHLVSDEVTNRWELAKMLAKKLGLEDKIGVYAKSGLSAQSELNRPLNCALSTKVRRAVLKTEIRGISEHPSILGS